MPVVADFVEKSLIFQGQGSETSKEPQDKALSARGVGLHEPQQLQDEDIRLLQLNRSHFFSSVMGLWVDKCIEGHKLIYPLFNDFALISDLRGIFLTFVQMFAFLVWGPY